MTLEGYIWMKACGVKVFVLLLKVITVKNIQN